MPGYLLNKAFFAAAEARGHEPAPNAQHWASAAPAVAAACRPHSSADEQLPEQQVAAPRPPVTNGASGSPPDPSDSATPNAPQHAAPASQHRRTLSGNSSIGSEDFERTAEPLVSSGYGDQESMLPVMAALSFKDPSKEVVLRLECVDEQDARVVIVISRMASTLGTMAVVTLLVLKFAMDDSWFSRDRTVYILNLCLGSVCLAVSLVASTLFGRLLLKAKLSGKRWSRRRGFFSIATYAQLVVQTVSLVFFVLPNAWILSHSCAWFHSIVRWSAIVRWECWGLIFLNFAILAHATNPWVNPKSPNADALTMDAPFWSCHWWKVAIMVVYSALNLAAGAVLQHDEDAGRLPLTDAVDANHRSFALQCQRNGRGYDCKLDDAALALACVLVAILLCFLALWIFFIVRALRAVSRKSYTDNRIANLSIRLQIRNKLVAVFLFILSVILLFYLRVDTCSSFAESWAGFLGAQIVLTVASISGCYAYIPKSPDAIAPVLQVWLQQFAWSEQGRQHKLRLRERLVPVAPGLRDAPMFCFETAVRLFYWSALVYRYESENVKDNTYTLSTAMRLYHLDRFELLWERKEDTKVLLAWSDERIVLSFRGTASLTNVLADLQFWLSAHPAAQQASCFHARPAVHAGFLRSWLSNGLNARVLQRIEEILEQSGEVPGVVSRKVYLTGHSLGGALAHLAGYDIIKAFPGLQVAVYTFGAPRVGNHAFAKDYNDMVPDSWAMINDQDVVTRGGKFYRLYKRVGNRVLINRQGDMLVRNVLRVRPSFVEASLRRVPWGSLARDHLLASYKESMIAIMLRQFDRSKGFKDGMQGVMELAESIQVMKRDNAEPKTAREAELRTKLAALIALPGAAAGAAVGAAAGAVEAAGEQLHEGAAAVFECVRASTELPRLQRTSLPGSRRTLGGVDSAEPPCDGQQLSRRTVPGLRTSQQPSQLSDRMSREDLAEKGCISGDVSPRSSADSSRQSLASRPRASLDGIVSSGTFARRGHCSRRGPPQGAKGHHAPSLLQRQGLTQQLGPSQHPGPPEGLQPGGADTEHGITYEAGVRHSLGGHGSGGSSAEETAVTRQGHWPGEKPGATAAARGLGQVH